MFARLFCLILICSANFASAAARSGNDNDSTGEGTLQKWITSGRTDQPPAKEDPFTMPELAGLKDWRSYPLAEIMGNTRIEIAADSVQSGKDGIIRYAIAITPRSGTRNVLFEGLDCDTMRYRSYAFGQPDKTWKKLETVTWRAGKLQTINHWQGPLLKEFCGFSGANPSETIIKSLRGEPFPKSRDDSRGKASK